METTLPLEHAHTPFVSADPLRTPLLDSRQRWRGFAMVAADWMFETDLAGRLTFLAPEQVLGWPAATLLGQAAETLLAGEPGAEPFRFKVAAQGRRVWLRDAAGRSVCMAISAVALLDEAGCRVGTRGVGVDVTEREWRDTASAAALRRGDVLDHILDHMRQEVIAPRMMQAVLDAVMRAMGGVGAAVLDLTLAPDDEKPDAPWPVLHHAGADPAPILACALALLQDREDSVVAEGRPLPGRRPRSRCWAARPPPGSASVPAW